VVGVIPKQRNLEIPLLDVIMHLGGKASRKDVLEHLAATIPELTADDMAVLYPSGRYKWDTQVDFTKVSLVESGDLENANAGVWSITPQGRRRVLDVLSGRSLATKVEVIQGRRPQSMKKESDSSDGVLKRLVHEKPDHDPESITGAEADALLKRLNDVFRTGTKGYRLKIIKLIERDSSLARLVKWKRGYQCQLCGPACPHVFLTRDNVNYVEAHHLEKLADGGLDLEHNIVVLCAVCHRRFHHGVCAARWVRNKLDLVVNLGDGERMVSNYLDSSWSVRYMSSNTGRNRR
jgi:5-methylcytosine-specific restriction endonuclease McrA